MQKIKEEKFPNIEYLDYNDFYLETEDYGDFAHLNYRGAKKLSFFFNTLIEKELLNKKDKFLLIQDQMKIFSEKQKGNLEEEYRNIEVTIEGAKE